MTISERFKELRTKLGLKQPAIAIKFGIPLTSWKKYESGPSEPGSEPLSLLAKGGVNTNWLLTGDGDMFLKPLGQVAYGHSEDACQARIGVTTKEPPVYMQDFALIPFYDVEVSAGHGSHVDQELQTGQMAFKTNWLKQRNLQPGKCALIKARGDSMEPTIYDGDLLLVDMSVNSIIDDTIYIVQTDNRLIVKRIQLALDGSLTIISDNKKYKEQTITPDQAKDVKIAGRVRWYGHEI
jgi:phage repressor protein C with HTH and peptisase S24 domain